MRIFSILLIFSFLAGCAMPNTTVRAIDARPSIAIQGASSTADLIVDGLKMGRAETFNGAPTILRIEPGTHRVSILDNGKLIYDQNIFVESELKTITVR